MKVFSGSSNKPLAEKIAQAMGTELSPIEIFVFPDGERRIQIQEDVVGTECIVVQTTAMPVDQNYMELFFIIDGLIRSGAQTVSAVIPYLGYQRQDHVFRDGEAVSLDVIIRTLEGTGADQVVTFDLHSIKIPEVFRVPLKHLSALPLFAKKIKDLGDGVLVSPDMGGLRRISKMSELLEGMDWVATVKDRDLNTGEIVINTIDPSAGAGQAGLKDKSRAFIVDDMIASGKTIVESAKLLQHNGINEMYVFATHAVFTKEAPELLQNSPVHRVFVTDTVDVPKEKQFEKLEILSIGDMVARELHEEVKS